MALWGWGTCTPVNVQCNGTNVSGASVTIGGVTQTTNASGIAYFNLCPGTYSASISGGTPACTAGARSLTVAGCGATATVDCCTTFCSCSSCLVPGKNLTLSVTGDVVTGPPPSPFAPNPTAPYTITCTLAYIAGPPCSWSGTLSGIPGYKYGPCSITAGISCDAVNGVILTIGGCSTQNNCASANFLVATSLVCGSGFLWTGTFNQGGTDCCPPLSGSACGNGSGFNGWTVSA